MFYRHLTWRVRLKRSSAWHYYRDELKLPRELGLSLSKPVCSPVDRAVLRRLMFIISVKYILKSLNHGIKDRLIFKISFQETNSLFSCVGHYRLPLIDFTHSLKFFVYISLKSEVKTHFIGFIEL